MRSPAWGRLPESSANEHECWDGGGNPDRLAAKLTMHAGTQFDPQIVEVLVGLLYGVRQSGAGAA